MQGTYFDMSSGAPLLSSVQPLPAFCANAHAPDVKAITHWLCTLADPTFVEPTGGLPATKILLHTLQAIFARPEFIFKNVVCTVYNAYLKQVHQYTKPEWSSRPARAHAQHRPFLRRSHFPPAGGRGRDAR